MKKPSMRTTLAGVGALICAFAVAAVAYGAVTPIPPDDPSFQFCIFGDDSPVPGGVALQGDGADDKITGTPKRDFLQGGGGDDTITALSGDDRCMDGGDGRDELRGGGGKDLLFGGNGRDVLRGGGGDDRLLSGDPDGAAKDKINCGAGQDIVEKDSKDVVKKNCETLTFPH